MKKTWGPLAIGAVGVDTAVGVVGVVGVVLAAGGRSRVALPDG